MKKKSLSWIIHFIREDFEVKKAFLLSILLLLSGLALSAQSVDSEFYSADLMVISVAPHPLGYKVVYYDRYANLHDLYLPLEWFQSDPAGKAEIVYGAGETYPYLSVIFKNAQIHHIRLYVFETMNHPSWGTLSRQLDLTDEFDLEFEELDIQF